MQAEEARQGVAGASDAVEAQLQEKQSAEAWCRQAEEALRAAQAGVAQATAEKDAADRALAQAQLEQQEGGLEGPLTGTGTPAGGTPSRAFSQRLAALEGYEAAVRARQACLGQKHEALQAKQAAVAAAIAAEDVLEAADTAHEAALDRLCELEDALHAATQRRVGCAEALRAAQAELAAALDEALVALKGRGVAWPSALSEEQLASLTTPRTAGGSPAGKGCADLESAASAAEVAADLLENSWFSSPHPSSHSATSRW